MLLLEKPTKPMPKPVQQAEPEPEVAAVPVAQAAPEVIETPVEDVIAEAAPEEALAEVPAEAIEPEDTLAEGEIEIREGESLAEIKDRIRKEQQKVKKPTIPPELLNGANSYEDKVGIVRMVVQSDQARVASAIRGMIQVK